MEDIDEKYTWPVLKWLNNRRSYIITFLVSIGLFAYINHEWQQVIRLNRELIMTKAHKHIDETELLEQLAQQGDAFGSVNAWFSGIAMLAAILAIVFQTFEFGHQREELARTTQAHFDRLDFDETVHFHNRRMLIIEFIRRIHSQDIQKILRKLRIRYVAEQDGIGLKEAFILSCDDARYSLATVNRKSPRGLSVINAVDEIENSAPLFNLLLEVGIFEPEGPEVIYTVPLYHEVASILYPIFDAMDQVKMRDLPLWVSAAKRWSDLLEEQMTEKESL